MHLWRYSEATDVGLQRNNNEDSYLSCPDLGLWIVADGMGGHAAGEVASAIVTETIREGVKHGATLKQAIQNSHGAVLHAAENGEGGQGMGSTVVVLQSRSEQYQIAWVGDSRAYLWSPHQEKQLRQLTTDHSYVQMLYQTGAISEEELETHPEKNIITQCLGSLELAHVRVDTVEGTWERGDRIILCSDGLSDVVPEALIAEILDADSTTDTITHNLIQAALEHGGKDNVTVTVVDSPSPYANFLHRISSSLSKFLQ